jgi:NADPH-dependent glutamate synthase beta subunit-like oxidoreductase
LFSGKLLGKINEVIEDCMGDAPAYCSATCPLHIDPKTYIDEIKEGKYEKAIETIRENTIFPGVLGRICAHPCEEECKRNELESALSIKNLKRFAADYDDPVKWDLSKESPTDKKIAVVGAGPAGATAAFELAKKGHEVVVYEALPEVGGMLRVGIPSYRLPADVIDEEYSILEKLGVEIKLNTKVGEDISFAELENNYDSVFIAAGAHKSIMLPLEGSDLDGILPGTDILRKAGLGQDVEIGKKVVVVGGGNVAMDVARTVWRLGAEDINIVCLESKDEMPAHSWEIEDAIEEGINVHCSWGPMRFEGSNGKLEQIRVKKCDRVFDSEGNFNPCYDEDNNMVLEADNVIMAIGQSAETDFVSEEKVNKSRGNKIKVDPVTLQTQKDNIFAGGDVAGRPLLAVEAMAHGRKAAISIDRYLKGEDLYENRDHEGSFDTWLETEIDEDEPKRERVGMRMMPVEDRKGNFDEVELGFSEEQALEEAERCLTCECKLCVKECEFLDEYTEHPKEMLEEILNAPYGSIDIPYYCNLCETCTVHCPKDFELADIFLEIRRDYYQDGEGPLKAHNPITKFHQPLGKSGMFTLTKKDQAVEKTERLFFPGCSLSSYSPEVVTNTYKYLKDVMPGTGFLLRCCAAPTNMLGQTDKFEKMIDELVAEIEKTGAKELITACADCTHNLMNALPDDIEVRTLYSVIAEYGIPEDRKNVAAGRVMSIHDSCTGRHFTDLHDQVRKIASDLGLEIQELEHIRENTRCCGFGGMVVPANPDLATNVMKRRAGETDKEMITYCAACRESMTMVGKPAYHLLEFVFSDQWKEGANGNDNPLKQWFNRWQTKRKVSNVK